MPVSVDCKCASIGLSYDQTFGLISNMFLEFEKEKYDFFCNISFFT